MSQNTKRNSEIDIMRGILIILMVVGHSGCPMKMERFIYLFHLPAFMILSGYCYRNHNSQDIQSIKKYLARKIKSMYIPYILANGTLILLHNFFVKLYFYNDTRTMGKTCVMLFKNFLFAGTEQLFGALWYLRILFVVVILWNITDFVSNNIKKCLSPSLTGGGYAICMLYIGYLMNRYNIRLGLSLECIFTYSFFFALGVSFRRNNIYKLFDSKLQIALTIVSLIVLLIISQETNWIGATGSNSYSGIVSLMIMSISGWCMVKGVAIIIDRYFSVTSKIFKKIGRETMIIMFMHFISFKLVILIQIFVLNLPIEYLNIFPIYSGERLWWIVYSLLGVSVPMFVKAIYSNSMKKLIV